MFKKILELLGLRKNSRHAYGEGTNKARFHGNANSAIQKVTSLGYRYKETAKPRPRLIKGERKIYGMWCVRSKWPEHNGAYIGGWYDTQTHRTYVCCNPEDWSDYDDRVEEHEYAHHIEHRLRIAPPWHYARWRRLFYLWRGLTSNAMPEFCHGCVYDFVDGQEGGDVVEVDVVLSQGDDKTK